MEELASRTGGKAYYNNNDLKMAVRKAIDDSRVTYSIGYYPSSDLDDRFHDVKVQVKRKGVNIRYRKGYFAFAERQASEKDRKEAMRETAWSPLQATSIGLQLRADRLPSPKQNTVRFVLLIDPRDVTLDPSGEKDEERWAGAIDVAFVQRDVKGKDLDGINDRIDMKLKPDRYAKMQREGLLLSKDIELKAGATEVRAVVRDSASGNSGSVIVPLDKIVKPQ